MDAVTPLAASAWTLVDLLLGIGLALSVLVGLWRGLVTEMMSLLGWGVAYFAAQWLGPSASGMVPIGELGSRTNVVAGMVVAFVLVWVVWALLSWAIVQAVRASVLSGPDRLMGAVFGLMRGLVVALVVATLVSMTPIARWEPWQTSRGVAWLEVLMRGLRPILPAQVVQFLPAQAETPAP
jgi:membrane protein required for colicin V production